MKVLAAMLALSASVLIAGCTRSPKGASSLTVSTDTLGGITLGLVSVEHPTHLPLEARTTPGGQAVFLNIPTGTYRLRLQSGQFTAAITETPSIYVESEPLKVYEGENRVRWNPGDPVVKRTDNRTGP